MILQIEKDGQPIYCDNITIYINGKQFTISSKDNETLTIDSSKTGSELVTKVEMK